MANPDVIGLNGSRIWIQGPQKYSMENMVRYPNPKEKFFGVAILSIGFDRSFDIGM